MAKAKVYPARDTELRFVGVVRREEKRAPGADQRRRLNWVLCEYRTPDGIEFRRAFESYGNPDIPMVGTIESTAKAQRQW